jgi:hypothetical protein
MDKQNDSLMHGFTTKRSPFHVKLIGLLILFVFLGGLTGYLLAKSRGSSTSLVGKVMNNASLSSGKIVGDGDPKIFKDTAEGVLKDGGIEGEGQYHLERPGGVSQNVYMTSSTVDLAQFLDRKIKVWGQTQSAQKAGWLMDVGRVEVL